MDACNTAVFHHPRKQCKLGPQGFQILDRPRQNAKDPHTDPDNAFRHWHGH